MKYYKICGLFVCIILAGSCFLPWAYYPDLHKSFTGFFSEKNMYGKPGILFTFFAAVSVLLVFINKIWAKRTLIFFAAFNLGYLIKTYITYTSCYGGYCPQKQYGLYLLIFSAVSLMIVSLFPDLELKINESTDVNNIAPEE